MCCNVPTFLLSDVQFQGLELALWPLQTILPILVYLPIVDVNHNLLCSTAARTWRSTPLWPAAWCDRWPVNCSMRRAAANAAPLLPA